MASQQDPDKRPHIIVVDYDPSWADAFESYRDHVWPHVKDCALSIEHVGSTAVPGLAAKPIIDMDVIVTDEVNAQKAIKRLGELGYIHLGERGIAGRHAFIEPATTPPHHLYVCIEGTLGLKNHILLRDHLRTHPEAVRGYAMLKRLLAIHHSNDIEAYVDGKTSFIVNILSRYNLLDDEVDEIVASNEKTPKPNS